MTTTQSLAKLAGIYSSGQLDATIEQKTQYADLFSDAIVSGLTTATSSTLSGTLSAGVAYVLGNRVSYGGGSYTVTASTVSYLDLSVTGTLSVSTSATVTLNSLRLWSITSDASTIKSTIILAGYINRMTTAGDLIIGGIGGTPTRLAEGTTGQVLTVGTTGLAWATAAGNASQTFNVAPATTASQAVQYAQTYVRPNLCPDVDQWIIGAGGNVSNGVAGKAVTWGALANGVYLLATSPSMICSGGATYVVTGDSALFATSAYADFDLEFFDSSGNSLLQGPQSPLYAPYNFATDNNNRNGTAVQVTAPSTAVTMKARFIVNATNNVTAAGFRQVKVEQGTLPATPYTQEADVAAKLNLSGGTLTGQLVVGGGSPLFGAAISIPTLVPGDVAISVTGSFAWPGSSSHASFIDATSPLDVIRFGVNSSEKARVDPSGNFLVGTTTSPAGGGNIVAAGTIITGTYTVATLPVGTTGQRAFVTDATTPSFLQAVTGGGTVGTPVFYNGSAWIVG